MEFWGIEVKAGQKIMVQPEFGQLIHISQAAVGEVKDGKGSKSFPLRLKIDDKNFVIGTLSTEDRTQVMFDLVFEKEFELSHDWKHGSIYFMGYVADDPASEGSEFSDSDDSLEEEEEEPVEAPVEAKENGAAKAKAVVAAKPAVTVPVAKKGAAAKGKKVVEPAAAKGKKVEEPESDDDEDDSDDDSDDEMAIDGLPEADSDDASDDDSEEDDESEEELPKVQESKKRPAPSAEKTPVAKKPKQPSPGKSGKKVQNTTPADAKSAGKTPKSKGQSPKSAGQVSCKSCPKSFPTEFAMLSHAKAKHGGK